MDSCYLKRKRPPQIEIPNVLREISAAEADLTSKATAPITQNDAVRSSAKGVGVFSLKGRKKLMEDSHKIVSFPRAKKGICSGVCCVTALIEGDEIIVSNLGDCRAVLCRGGSAEVLTKDHRAGQEDEKKRIEDNGGYVEIHRGAWRVHGVLSVSRSIGDSHLKDWVVAEPETKRMTITSDMQYLVLASDGLWDKVGNQEAIDVVMQSCQKETTPSQPKNDNSKENEFEFNCKSTSPSPKLKRISMVKSNKGREREFGNENESPAAVKSLRISLGKSSIWKETADSDFIRENGSPVKAQRTSVAHSSIRVSSRSPCSRRSDDSLKENEENSYSLVAACQRLANLAVTRGSWDDVTVMIVDLGHFKY
ncbi:unnamed protein product [Cuscuta epithymum]|uniref:PPM-type phosphatase domain-containing protein n=1 Tax=Cuscuta epithymum TaxID=186058 RepID=A0AAV0DQW9_9ASTE|nr:unnamed protein product [Cuscuta epithymum]